MNLEHIANTIDYTPSRNEWINDAESISRQISANLIMILCGKYFSGIKWNTKRNHKLLYDLCKKIINQGGGYRFNNGRWAAFLYAFQRREIETRHWIEKEKETWSEREEGMSVEVLDKIYWDYSSSLTCFRAGIEEKDIKWITYGLKNMATMINETLFKAVETGSVSEIEKALTEEILFKRLSLRD